MEQLLVGVSTALVTRAQMRRELEYAYYRELWTMRVDAYRSLFSLTQALPPYWPSTPDRQVFREARERLHTYFEGGGRFLTTAVKVDYFRVQDTFRTICQRDERDSVSDSEIDQLAEVGEELRRQLAEDVGTAERPQLITRAPVAPPKPPAGE